MEYLGIRLQYIAGGHAGEKLVTQSFISSFANGLTSLDANTLAKIARGICDDLVRTVASAWETPGKPLLSAPAMNTSMLNQPVTTQHVDTLKSWGFTEIPTIAKRLACGDYGEGWMTELGTIVDAVLKVRSGFVA